MSPFAQLFRTRTSRIAAVALVVLTTDQFSKALVLRYLGFHDEAVVIPGFFKFVHWQNTGAAWSLFTGNNKLLAIVAVAALIVLFLGRHHFDSRSRLGQFSLGLIFGGILGNLVDRVRVGHVVDFIYFFLPQRNGTDLYFPAFNVADSAICVGVGLIFLLSWLNERQAPSSEQPR